MSTDRTEFGIPVIFDVLAYDREDAGEALVDMLKHARVVGREFDTIGRGTAECVSWWTLEKIDKEADRNDNDPGVVVFKDDLDYLLSLLHETMLTVGTADKERHKRLFQYFQPCNRIGWTEAEPVDDTVSV